MANDENTAITIEIMATVDTIIPQIFGNIVFFYI